MRDKNPFSPYNGPQKNNPFAIWNNPMYKNNPFACWNNPFGVGYYRDEVYKK